MVAELVTSTDGILTTSVCCEKSSATYGVRLVDTDANAAAAAAEEEEEETLLIVE